MMSRMAASRSLPLVRLSLILPVVEELDRRGVDADAVLASSALVRDTVRDRDVFVPPIIVHRFLEDAAEAAADPYLGVRVGETLDDPRWSPLADAVSHAKTLGDFIIRFVRAARDDASSARHALEVGPESAAFREIRTSEQEIAPAQNDAFTAGYILRILRRGAGASWNPADVTLTVCEPSALPARYMGVHVARGDRIGITVRFPSSWLLQPFDRRGFLDASPDHGTRTEIPTRFVEALRRALEPHLHAPDLGVEFVARLLGTSRQSLQRRLRANGTTLSAVIRDLKKERAVAELARSKRPITAIAESLGFQNPTSFTRAFKSWTGESPRACRARTRTI